MDNLAEYRNNFIVSAEFNDTGNNTLVNGFYSGVALHSVPLTVNLLSNSLIKIFVNNKHSIQVSRQKLPNTLASTKRQVPEEESLPRTLIFCSFFFPTVALFLGYPLQERTTKVKQLQRMTGVTSMSYWGTMFILDFLIYTICVLLITLAFYIMDVILDIRLYYRVEISKSIHQLKLMLYVILLTYFHLCFFFSSVLNVASRIVWY